ASNAEVLDALKERDNPFRRVEGSFVYAVFKIPTGADLAPGYRKRKDNAAKTNFAASAYDIIQPKFIAGRLRTIHADYLDDKGWFTSVPDTAILSLGGRTSVVNKGTGGKNESNTERITRLENTVQFPRHGKSFTFIPSSSYTGQVEGQPGGKETNPVLSFSVMFPTWMTLAMVINIWKHNDKNSAHVVGVGLAGRGVRKLKSIKQVADSKPVDG
ncbi:MAG: hypothetical protein ACOYME_11000, partial [Prochlorotrichaceae cyanobacterium]